MDETNFLDREDDKAIDHESEVCERCGLPKAVVTYELGFQMMRQQLSELKTDLRRIMNKIDTLEHK